MTRIASVLQPVKEIISGVVGETCWQASFSYGDELTLDIGAKVPSSKLPRKMREETESLSELQVIGHW